MLVLLGKKVGDASPHSTAVKSRNGISNFVAWSVYARMQGLCPAAKEKQTLDSSMCWDAPQVPGTPNPCSFYMTVA
jgi:hypothetical protein